MRPRRKDFLHKLTTKLVRENQAIYTETLAVKKQQAELASVARTGLPPHRLRSRLVTLCVTYLGGTPPCMANHKLAQRVRADRRLRARMRPGLAPQDSAAYAAHDWGSFASRAIADCGWGEALRQFQYKCKWHDRVLGAIDRWFPSSKRCNSCGHILDKLPLDVREWVCPSCSSRNPRDKNAALNILAVGQTVFACGLSSNGDTSLTYLVNLG